MKPQFQNAIQNQRDTSCADCLLHFLAFESRNAVSRWEAHQNLFISDVNQYSMHDMLVASSKCDPDPPR